MIQIGGLQRTTLIDYPGRLAAVVFLVGCNFRCPFCYSSELVVPDLIEKHPRIDVERFFTFLEGRKAELEGVVICGGEPTINPDLIDFVRRIKSLGYLVKLDTNGSNPEMLGELIELGLIDYVAMDIKAPREKYGSVVGAVADLDAVCRSVELLKSCGVDYEFRTTVVPGIHTEEDIVEIAKWIGPAKRYFLQSFMGSTKTIDPEFEKVKPYPREWFEVVKEKIAGSFDNVGLRV